MAATGYFRLEHSSVNRATKGDGYLAASANYAANDNKCEKILHINMAANRHAIRDYIEKHEASLTRKNARLGDKILLSLDSRMSEAHREEAVRRFLWVITGEGRSQACSFYHTDKPHNPHHHVILLDADEYGESVMLMGASRKNRLKAGLEPNVTVWLRKTWERECNGVLEENGYDFRLDCRRNLEQGLPEPGEHRGWDNDNAIDAPLSTDIQLDAEPESVEAEEDFDGEDDVNETPAERITMLGESRRDLDLMHRAKREVTEAQKAYEAAVQRREQAVTRRDIYSAQTTGIIQQAEWAKVRLAYYTRDDGSLKGFGFTLPTIKIFGRSFGGQTLATEDRHNALRAQSDYQAFRGPADTAMRKREENDYHVTTAHKVENDTARDAYDKVMRLERLYGTEQDFAEAEQMFKDTIHRIAMNVSLQEAREAYASGEISVDDYREYLIESGHGEELREIEELKRQQQRDMGESL